VFIVNKIFVLILISILLPSLVGCTHDIEATKATTFQSTLTTITATASTTKPTSLLAVTTTTTKSIAVPTSSSILNQIVIANSLGTHNMGAGIDDNVAQTILGLVSSLGAPLPASELSEYQGIGARDSDGITLSAVFREPVKLYSKDGQILSTATLVCIQWDRSNNKPNRLFYGINGSKLFDGKLEFPQVIDGGFVVTGDIKSFVQVVDPLVMKGLNGIPTVTRS
jgi:hypothetical protein